tara:strand:+ start:887 stop:1078 length:192 start_codon:yes stop_codon:yes gene_type:complete
MKNNTIASGRLLSLKTILTEMLHQDRITETEMLDILRKAGLARLPESSSKWIDEEGSTYTSLD